MLVTYIFLKGLFLGVSLLTVYDFGVGGIRLVYKKGYEMLK